jgi:hypothetical protein
MGTRYLAENAEYDKSCAFSRADPSGAARAQLRAWFDAGWLSLGR